MDLVAAGALGLILTLVIFAPRRRRAVNGGVVEERRVYDDRDVV